MRRGLAGAGAGCMVRGLAGEGVAAPLEEPHPALGPSDFITASSQTKPP